MVSRRSRHVPMPSHPCAIGRFENAQQFFEFLSEREIGNLERPWRRCAAFPGIAILRCGHNVRAIFENATGGGAVVGRETLLAILAPPEIERLAIFEVGRLVFDLLSACEEWTDPATLAAATGHETLIEDLTRRGLLELRS
jgi:hypothetical protein